MDKLAPVAAESGRMSAMDNAPETNADHNNDPGAFDKFCAFVQTATNAVVGVVLREAGTDRRRQHGIELIINSRTRGEAVLVAQAIAQMFEAPLTRIEGPKAGDSPNLEQSQYRSKPAHTFYAKDGPKSKFAPKERATLDRIAAGLDFHRPPDRAQYRVRIMSMARARNMPLDAAGKLAEIYIAEWLSDHSG